MIRKSPSSKTSRGKVVEITLKRPIVFNDNVITKARIEIDHINYGLNKNTGSLNKKQRTDFTVADIEKFIYLLDGEYLYTDDYIGRRSRFRHKIDCPIRGRFNQKLFFMIFETDYDKNDELNTITIFPGW